jgi:uncharacterized membrane protein
MNNPKYPSGTGATAAILGHPLHPMLVMLPVASLVGAALCDWIYLYTGNSFWATGSFWLIAAGLVTGVVAAGAGIVDFMSVERARTMGIAWAHAIGNVVALGFVLVNYLVRRDNPADPPMHAIAISSGVFVALMITGWLGGELTFRHGIAVSRGIGGHSDDENPDLTPSGKLDIGKS